MGNEYLTEKAIELADKISEQLNEEELEIYLDCDDYKIIVEALRNNYREKSKWVYNQESGLSHCEKCGYYPMHGYWGEQDLGNYCPDCGAVMHELLQE